MDKNWLNRKLWVLVDNDWLNCKRFWYDGYVINVDNDPEHPLHGMSTSTFDDASTIVYDWLVSHRRIDDVANGSDREAQPRG